MDYADYREIMVLGTQEAEIDKRLAMATWGGNRCPETPREDGDHEWETDVVDVTLPGGGQERVITVLCRWCGKQKGKQRKNRKPEKGAQ